jgi:hypothetical protein
MDEAVAARDEDYLSVGTAGAAVIKLENGEAQAGDLGIRGEPPDGIEPSTYALRVATRAADDVAVGRAVWPHPSVYVRRGPAAWLLPWLLGSVAFTGSY